MSQNNEEALHKIMAQVQVYASSYSLVGTRFATDNQLEEADIEKLALYNMVKSALSQSPISQNEQHEVVAYADASLVCTISTYMIKELESRNETNKFPYHLWPKKLYTSPKQIPDEWVADPDTIPSQLIEITRQAICLEFGDSGTDGYYKRILAKIFKAMLNASPTTSLTSETNTEVGE